MILGLEHICALPLGLVLGSYAVTAAIRSSRGEGASAGRSRCDACGVFLPFSRTLPVLSYAKAQGRCRDCGVPIDPMHLLGEIAGAVVLSTAVWLSPVRGAMLALLGLVLIAASTIDLRTRRLPNSLTAAAAALSLMLAWTRSPSDLATGLVASLGCALVLMALRELRRRQGRDPGLGLGDVKLLAGLAIWLGTATAWAVGLAAVLGLVWTAIARPSDGRLAFGPMIAVAAWRVSTGLELGWWPILR